MLYIIEKTFNIDGDALQFPREEGKGHTYVTITEDSGEADKILQAVKMRGRMAEKIQRP